MKVLLKVLFIASWLVAISALANAQATIRNPLSPANAPVITVPSDVSVQNHSDVSFDVSVEDLDEFIFQTDLETTIGYGFNAVGSMTFSSLPIGFSLEELSHTAGSDAYSIQYKLTCDTSGSPPSEITIEFTWTDSAPGPGETPSGHHVHDDPVDEYLTVTIN